MGVKKKIDIYAKLVETKLLYGLASVCLTAAQARHLDGFQARCLRRILRIPAAEGLERSSFAAGWPYSGHSAARG